MQKRIERSKNSKLSENSEIYLNFMAQELPVSKTDITYHTVYTPKGSAVQGVRHYYKSAS